MSFGCQSCEATSAIELPACAVVVAVDVAYVKGKKAEASVSLATAEVDRSGEFSGVGMDGLSPAAKLARQHTLKSNAEAAARAKAHQEAQAAVHVAAASGPVGAPMPQTWEQNTATRHGVGAGPVREDGMRVVVEEDDSDEEGAGRRSEDLDIASGSDEDSTWHGHGHDEEEDVTVRMGGDRDIIEGDGSNMDHDDNDEVLNEPWAQNIRRSIERTRVPSKGILKSKLFTISQLKSELNFKRQMQTLIYRRRALTALRRISLRGLGPIPMTLFQRTLRLQGRLLACHHQTLTISMAFTGTVLIGRRTVRAKGSLHQVLDLQRSRRSPST